MEHGTETGSWGLMVNVTMSRVMLLSSFLSHPRTPVMCFSLILVLIPHVSLLSPTPHLMPYPSDFFLSHCLVSLLSSFVL